jgi:hypothetical protein
MSSTQAQFALQSIIKVSDSDAGHEKPPAIIAIILVIASASASSDQPRRAASIF